MRAAVYCENETISIQVANDISFYFHQRHPEYYIKILNYHSFSNFDAVSANYEMDLYILELNRCDESDAGYRIAMQVREKGLRCSLSFIVPSSSVALQIVQKMLQPSYIFLNDAPTNEIIKVLNNFLVSYTSMSFLSFTYQYKKWLLNTERITYIITNGTRSLLVCSHTTLETTERLAELERKLPDYFIRVDKGCLINTRQLAMANLAEQKVTFVDGNFAYMSRRGAQKLNDLLNIDRKKEE